MKKGQIFSVDLLLAAILVILLFGIIISTTEIKNYEQKESIAQIKNINSTKSAYYALTNSNYSCQFENINLTNSINTTELSSDDANEIRKYIGLVDKNYAILINGILIKNVGSVVGKNVISIDKNILTCNSQVNFNDINNCLDSKTCNVSKDILTLKVSG